MCLIPDHPDQLPLPLKLSDNGSTDSRGPTGEPSPSAELSDLMVRLHHGVSDISVGSLLIQTIAPGTFVALKAGPLDGYTVTLSFALTSSYYATLIEALERTSGIAGENVSVAVKFEPTTQNLAQSTTAPST